MKEIEGCIPALITPFNDDTVQSVNFEKLDELVRMQAVSGSAGVVLGGTTGESPTLSHEEHREVVQTAITAAKGTSLKIIAGTGSNSTREAVQLTAAAAELGVDACLVVVPYYNKPSVEGVYEHFKRLNEVGIPLIVYNIPGRTGINLPPDAIAKLSADFHNVIGLKASNGNLDEIIETAGLIRSQARPFSILSGDDSLTLPILAVGGVGVISVLANIAPMLMNQLLHAYRVEEDTERSTAIAQIIFPLCIALLRLGSNPAPIKVLMNSVGMNVGGCRLPLVSLTDMQTARLVSIARNVVSALMNYGIAVDATLESIR